MTDYMRMVECPRCGSIYPKYLAALSRKDNETKVCTFCGSAEALEAAGLAPPYDGPQYWKGEDDEEVHVATNGEIDTE